MITHEELATVGQRMLALVDHYRGGRGNLNYPLLVRLRGPLDPAALQQALDGLSARHESLRTTFARRRGLLTQLVHAPAPLPVTVVSPGSQARMRDLVRVEVATPLDPRRDSVRVTRWELDEQDSLLCLNVHHLGCDAWSCRVLTDDLRALLAGERLPPVGWQYRHFSQWQRRSSTADRMQADQAYWEARLAGVRAPQLSTGPDPAAGSGDRTLRLDLHAPAGARIRDLAREERTTPFAVLLSMFYLLLYAETGQADLALASPFANRVRPEVMGTVGFFANFLVLRTRIPADQSFPELLRRTHETITQANSHQASPYFVNASESVGAADRGLENVVFQMLPGLPEAARAGELELTVEPPELPSRFDLELCAIAHEGGYRLLFQYAPERIGDLLAGRLHTGFRSLVTQLTGIADAAL